MSFTVTVLGSSGSYAGPGNACSGYLLSADGANVLMDCGPGTLSRLGEHVHLASLDGVLLSHSHPDHWLELPILRNALKYVLGGEGLRVYGTAETRELAQHLSGELEPTFRWHDIAAGDDFTVGPFRVRTSRTDHPPETLALRIDHGGRSLAYSADTGPRWSLTDLGEGIDMALVEATYLDEAQTGGVHLTAAQAGRLARDADVAALVLTHLLPGADVEEYRRAAAETYGAPVHVAEPGATFTP
jgi:ribonuclease BN (tRNA processing enzyme)